jgi:hypothetical protein
MGAPLARDDDAGPKSTGARVCGGIPRRAGRRKHWREIGGRRGVVSTEVAGELKKFESTLQALVANLDSAVPAGQELAADELAGILDLCAWTHAEWVRIHPFVNGNGRTARLWANSLAKRYGLPGFVRLRPRADEGYTQAGIKAMQGDWKPTAVVIRRMLDDFLDEL